MTKPIKPAEWLVDLISAQNKPESTEMNSGSAEFLGTGHRNADLTSAAGFLVRRHAVTLDQLEAMLHKLNEVATHPLASSEVVAIARSVHGYASEPVQNLDEAHLSSDLAAYLNPNFRSVAGMGWLKFNGRYWDIDEGSKGVQEATKQFVKILYEAAKAGGDPDRIKATRCFLSNQKITNLIKLASSDPEILQDARDFDAKPSLLNLQNGTIDFSSGKIEFRPHDAADLLMKCADVVYDPKVPCPKFDAMLDSILSPEDSAFVLRLMGYAISGTFDQQTFAIFHGAGANGKSTLVNVILRLLGSYGLNVEPSTFMMQRTETIRNDIARLKGARLAVSSELGVGEMLNAPLLKRYVGGDPLTARFLFKEYITFRPTAVPIFVTNALPIINGADQALARRIVLLHFDRVVPVDQRDPRLPEKLWQERSGILNRILEGLADYLSDRNLRVPQSVSSAVSNYVDASDLIAQFLADNCEMAPSSTVAAAELYDAYRVWCFEHGVKALSRPTFKTELEKREGIRSKRTSKSNVWEGLSVRPTGEPIPGWRMWRSQT